MLPVKVVRAALPPPPPPPPPPQDASVVMPMVATKPHAHSFWIMRCLPPPSPPQAAAVDRRSCKACTPSARNGRSFGRGGADAGGDATVGDDHRTRHVGSIVGGEKCHDFRDFLRP